VAEPSLAMRPPSSSKSAQRVRNALPNILQTKKTAVTIVDGLGAEQPSDPQ
jgi:hypothetical protein